MQRNKYETVAVQIGSVGYLSEPAGHLKRCSFFTLVTKNFTGTFLVFFKQCGYNTKLESRNKNGH